MSVEFYDNLVKEEALKLHEPDIVRLFQLEDYGIDLYPIISYFKHQSFNDIKNLHNKSSRNQSSFASIGEQKYTKTITIDGEEHVLTAVNSFPGFSLSGIEVDDISFNKITITRKKDGVLHRPDGGVTEATFNSRILQTVSFHKDGKLFNENHPCHVEFILNFNSNPSVIQVDEAKEMESVKYFFNIDGTFINLEEYVVNVDEMTYLHRPMFSAEGECVEEQFIFVEKDNEVSHVNVLYNYEDFTQISVIETTQRVKDGKDINHIVAFCPSCNEIQEFTYPEVLKIEKNGEIVKNLTNFLNIIIECKC